MNTIARSLLLLLAALLVACPKPTSDTDSAVWDSSVVPSSNNFEVARAADGDVVDSSGHHLGAYLPGAATLPINLAGGSGSVINVLPTGNQQAQSMSGDVTGTTNSNTVVGITGSAGQVTVSPTNVTWSSGTSAPALNQATTASSTGQTMHIAPQQSTQGTTETGGNLSVDLQTPLGGGGNEAYLTVTRGGAGNDVWQIGILTGNASYAALYPMGVTPGTGTYALAATSTSALLNAPTTGGSVTIGTANNAYWTLTSTSINAFSGAQIVDPWQGSASGGQSEKITYIPIVGQTPVASAGTIYTYTSTTNTTFSLEAHLVFKTGGNGAVGCVAEFANSSGTVSAASTAQLYVSSGLSASCNFSISGANVNVQGISGVSSTCNWQGYVIANVN